MSIAAKRVYCIYTERYSQLEKKEKTMKLYYFLLIIFLSCNSKAQNKSNCFTDKGIKTAMIEATLLRDKMQTVSATIHFNKLGMPIIRDHIERKIELNYDSTNLTRTIIHNYKEIENLSTIDTNVVTKNDELGRPLKIIGTDGRTTEYNYQNCNEQLEIYKESNGKLIHKFKSIFKDGLLVETIWIQSDNTQERKTKYFDYKFDNFGYWIERKYQYSDGELILESRKLEYY